MELPTPILIGRDYLKKNDINIIMRSKGECSYIEVRINGTIVSVTPKNDDKVTIITLEERQNEKVEQGRNKIKRYGQSLGGKVAPEMLNDKAEYGSERERDDKEGKEDVNKGGHKDKESAN